MRLSSSAINTNLNSQRYIASGPGFFTPIFYIYCLYGVNMRKLFIAALVILPLTACTTYGNKSLKDESQQTVKNKIVKGKTTQQDVINAFGEPQTRATNDGQEMWSYSSMSGESQISNYIPGLALLKNSNTAHMNSLEIWFKGNVVDRYNFSQTASKVSKGLLD